MMEWNSKAGMGWKQSTLRLPESAADIGYLAGLLDGEGSICVKKDTGTYSVCVYNSDAPLIEWLTSIGGRVEILKDSPLSRKACFRWTISRQAEVLILLSAIYQHLRIKKEKAASAIAVLKTRQENATRKIGDMRKALDLAEQGLTLQKIADQSGVKKGTIAYRLCRVRRLAAKDAGTGYLQ
jgi:hypothetical protein